MTSAQVEELPAQSSPRGRTLWIALTVVFCLTLTIALLSHFTIHRPLVNDEAVELVIGTGIPLDKFYFWSTQEAYPEGYADKMETGVSYVHRFLAHFTKDRGRGGEFVASVKVFFALSHALGAMFLALAATRLWGLFWGCWAGLMIGTSSFALIVNNIVTRNGVSLFWSTLAIYLLARFFTTTSIRRWIPILCLAVVLVLGCWTYTSFRMLAAAVYFALAIDWLRFDRGRQSFIKIATSLGLFALLLLSLIKADGGSLLSFADRGSYVLGEASDYFRRLWPTLLSPGYYVSPDVATFVVEDVHVLVGRQVLALWLAPFFAIGCFVAWRRKSRFIQLITIGWIFGMAVCALGGANMKYVLVFLPITLLITMSGVRATVGYMVKKWARIKWVPAGCSLFLVLIAGGELSDVFIRFPKSERSQLNAVSERMGDYASTKTEGFAKVYIQPGLGFDIVMWRLRLLGNSRVVAFPTLNSLRSAMENEPPPPNSLLLIDYPTEAIPAEQGGWSPPGGVRIVNVRDTL